MKYDSKGNRIEWKIRDDRGNNSIETFSYYENGQVKEDKRMEYGSSWVNYYNANGKLIKMTQGIATDPEQQKTVYTYDSKGLLIRLENFSEGKIVYRIEYHYKFYN